MEMIWHKAIRQYFHRESFLGLLQNIFKQNIVFFCKENPHPGIGAVYDVVTIIANVGPGDTRHVFNISDKKGT